MELRITSVAYSGVRTCSSSRNRAASTPPSTPPSSAPPSALERGATLLASPLRTGRLTELRGVVLGGGGGGGGGGDGRGGAAAAGEGGTGVM
jgi:hypothetical protein